MRSVRESPLASVRDFSVRNLVASITFSLTALLGCADVQKTSTAQLPDSGDTLALGSTGFANGKICAGEDCVDYEAVGWVDYMPTAEQVRESINRYLEMKKFAKDFIERNESNPNRLIEGREAKELIGFVVYVLSPANYYPGDYRSAWCQADARTQRAIRSTRNAMGNRLLHELSFVIDSIANEELREMIIEVTDAKTNNKGGEGDGKKNVCV